MQQERMYYVDNLRLLVIILVVCLHAAISYSGLGSWYYTEGLALGRATHLFFAVFQCFLQAFFMGALFMVAGYFAAASLRSRGTREFLKGRCIRLGLPTLCYMLAINPLTVYFLKDWDHSLITVSFPRYYAHYLTSLTFLSGTGPMWFALALLIFCVVYSLVRAVIWAATVPAAWPFPPRFPVLLALAVSAGAFSLRLVWPIGTGISNMQLCYFSSYVLLFCFGIAAHGNGWLERITYTLGLRCLIVAFLGIAVLLAFIVYGVPLEGNEAFRGGLNWQSLFFSVWESFTGVFMSVGLAAVLRKHWNSQGAFVKGLSASAFAVYMFHAPILVLLAQLLRPVELAAFPKFLLLFALALPISFGAARLIRATPLLRDMVRS